MRTLLSPKTALWICRILSYGFAAVFLLITVRTAKENLLAGGTLILFSALFFLLVSKYMVILPCFTCC